MLEQAGLGDRTDTAQHHQRRCKPDDEERRRAELSRLRVLLKSHDMQRNLQTVQQQPAASSTAAVTTTTTRPWLLPSPTPPPPVSLPVCSLLRGRVRPLLRLRSRFAVSALRQKQQQPIGSAPDPRSQNPAGVEHTIFKAIPRPLAPGGPFALTRGNRRDCYAARDAAART
ncbi:hypothetical protein Purlil1_4270 [Purpureocillium lilacinum]|uniref:Uncharacterized protein n=1 Tax=Purpureocillium lilacinum TaxID=33203 RepID=A0ABR0C4D4_PURLI|nr:hypothetical protein Purlil1_4270 [Purpureocillium lilacinum]